MQEFNAAKSAVLAACPDANVQKVCKDEYPVRVTVKDPEGNTLWENDQRQLFSKYASKRTTSMREIADAVAASRAE
jgi:hypothetical protein